MTYTLEVTHLPNSSPTGDNSFSSYLTINWKSLQQKLSLPHLPLSFWDGCGNVAPWRPIITISPMCDQPKTVKNMRAYIGTYKAISRLLPHCAHIISPLEDTISGSDSKDKLQWTPELESAFEHPRPTSVQLTPLLSPCLQTSYGLSPTLQSKPLV